MKYNKILVTGGSGLVGASLKKIYPNATYLSSKDYDLTKEDQVRAMYEKYKPDCVIHLAAKVCSAENYTANKISFFDDNILINTLVLKYAHSFGVKRFITLLSASAYPDIVSEYPIEEKMLHDGLPAEVGLTYGYTKRVFALQIDTYNQHYGTNYQYLIPGNLYSDELDFTKNTHFISMLLSKIGKANNNGDDFITLFGDGTPIRQFLHCDDLAEIMSLCLEQDVYTNMNIGTEDVCTIRELAETALSATDSFHLKLKFDKSKPNGQFRKDISYSKLKVVLPDFKFRRLSDQIKILYNKHFGNEN